jgi:hypothetical protein
MHCPNAKDDAGQGGLAVAQGIVHWKPPPSAVDAVRAGLDEDDTNSYCADD